MGDGKQWSSMYPGVTSAAEPGCCNNEDIVNWPKTRSLDSANANHGRMGHEEPTRPPTRCFSYAACILFTSLRSTPSTGKYTV